MKVCIRRISYLLLVLLMLFGAAAVCQAATTAAGGQGTAGTEAGADKSAAVRQIKVKKQTFSLFTKQLKKKASKVKVGTTALTLKKKEGYLRFTAPKTKVYTIRISSFLSKKKSTASVMFQAPDGDDPSFSFLIGIKKNGKVKESLEYTAAKRTAEKTAAAAAGKTFGGKTVKMNLKKGQTIYVYIGADYAKTTAMLQIQ